MRTVLRAGVTFNVWPAVRDAGTAVTVVEARSRAEAQELSRAGLMRLAVLALPQLARHIARRIRDDRTLVLLAQGLARRAAAASSRDRSHFPGVLLRRGSGIAARCRRRSRSDWTRGVHSWMPLPRGSSR